MEEIEALLRRIVREEVGQAGRTFPRFLTPAEVCERIPGLNAGQLAQLRFKRIGPAYYKPTAKTVLYDERDVLSWIIESRVVGRNTERAEGRSS